MDGTKGHSNQPELAYCVLFGFANRTQDTGLFVLAHWDGDSAPLATMAVLCHIQAAQDVVVVLGDLS